MKVEMNSLGKHYLAEFYDCNSDYLNDTSMIEEILIESVNLSGATFIKSMFHKFSPHGVSGIVVVAESHFAIHTWPEHSYAAVDIFSCGDFNYKAALKYIKDKIASKKFVTAEVSRGNLEKNHKLDLEQFTL